MAKPGQLMGFLSMFTHEPSPVSVRVVGPGEVLTFPPAVLRALTDRYPSVGQVLAATMAERLQDVLRDVLAHGRRSGLRHAETFPFRRRVCDAMAPDALILSGEATVGHAANAMREAGAGAVIVEDQGRPVGIVTERDLVLRVLANNLDPKGVRLREIMSTPLYSVPSDAYLYKAMGFMRTHKVLFLPVVDDGRLVGLLSIRDVLAYSSRETLSLVERIEKADDIAALSEVRDRSQQICLSLLEDNVPATEVSQILSSVNRDLHRQALEICLRQMEAQGKGPPPLAFCLIAMGSHGRAESHFATDQDHGMILADAPSERRAGSEAYFSELGARFTDAMTRIGFPRCEGGVMSENRPWRRPLSEWKQELASWFSEVDPVAVRRTTVFYDFVPLWGDVSLAARLRVFVTEGVQGNHKLIRRLFEDAAHHKVPLTFFKGFVTERSGPHKGQLDLKESGLRFVVECVRILALLYGITARSTIERMEELARAGVMPTDEGRLIRGAYQCFLRLLFAAQAEALRAGAGPCAYVSPAALPVEERYLLRLALEATARLQTLVHAAVHTPFVAGLQPGSQT
ncbi:MAG: CBS domain-containing protein [Deltaproteobacteria bacterium]|nr:CBS domain-containing protein [Deltaproteobacteria bacterium]